VELTETGLQNGQSWEASYRVRDNDSGLFNWMISGMDPAITYIHQKVILNLIY